MNPEIHAKAKLRFPVKHWPNSTSPRPKIADAGTIVRIMRKESATLFTVKAEDATDPGDTMLVAASELEAV